MSKSYKVFSRTLTMGKREGETVYSVRPVSYGTLTTDEVAKQISTESTATTADVKAVLDRYAYYVVENLAKGYNIELLGFGTLYLRFITNKAVTEPKKANANLVKSIVPVFRPSFSVDRNGKRTYDLIPNRISLVKYGEETVKGNDNDEAGGNNKPSGDGGNTPSTGGGSTPSGGDSTPYGGTDNENLGNSSKKISWVSILNAIVQAIIAALTALGVSSCTNLL